MKKAVFIILSILLLGLAGYFAYTQYAYSEGVRAGVLIKFSKIGYVFKTYEGELNLGGVTQARNTIMNSSWEFSVKDEETARKLMGQEGKRMQLHYKEINKNFFFQGQTKFFVDSVRIID